MKMLSQENNKESELSKETVIDLTAQVTDNELEQLLSNRIEAAESCPGGVCQLNWRPNSRAQAA